MRHRLAVVFTVIGAIALPIVMAATVLYASDAAIGDAGEPLAPNFGTTAPATTQTPAPKHHRHSKDHDGGATTGGGDTGGPTSGGSSSGGGSDDGSGGGSSHGGDDGGGRGHGGGDD